MNSHGVNKMKALKLIICSGLSAIIATIFATLPFIMVGYYQQIIDIAQNGKGFSYYNQYVNLLFAIQYWQNITGTLLLIAICFFVVAVMLFVYAIAKISIEKREA
jgi:hypothetical protein